MYTRDIDPHRRESGPGTLFDGHRCGARSLVLGDKVGTPRRWRYNLVKFVLRELCHPSGETIRVDGHGHLRSRLAIANYIARTCGGRDQ